MDMMKAPNDPREFLNQYSFKDEEHFYTNGSSLIPVFRVEQMIECYFEEAFEKQIPKKPEPKKDASGEYYVCPICGVYQEYLTDGKPPYCVNCGQALDWREVEE